MTKTEILSTLKDINSRIIVLEKELRELRELEISLHEKLWPEEAAKLEKIEKILEKKANSVEAFEARFNKSEWNSFLKSFKLNSRIIDNNIHLVIKRFETLDNLKEFIEMIVTSPKMKDLNKLHLRRYIIGALLNEVGLQ